MNVTDFANQHQTWLRIAKTFTGNAEDAADLVQDMYIKLIAIEAQHGTLSHLCPANKPNVTWCYSVLRNAHITNLRKAKEVFVVPSEEATEADTVKDEQLNALWRAVGALNQNTATSYECRYFLYYIGSGKSLRELAAENNTSLWVINGAIRNAKRRLAELIEGERIK